MGFAATHARGSKFSINTEGFEFKKISDFEVGKTLIVRGVMVNKGGKYGESASLILDDCFMNIPKHMVDDCKDILSSTEAIEQIEAGLLGAEIYEYEDSYTGAKQRSIKWLDL